MCFGKSVKAWGYIATAAMLLALAATARAGEAVPIYLDTYRPYITPKDAPRGSLMRLVDMVLEDAGTDHIYRYEDYAFGFHRVQTEELAASFPWRKTPEWETLFTYSKPLVIIETQFYYNQRFHRQPIQPSQLPQMTLGRLESYGYEGSVLAPLEAAKAEGRLVLLKTESEAINALLSGRIDAVPLQKVVAQATLQSQFANLAQLIQPVIGVGTAIPFHMIAPKTPAGKRFIQAFNASFDTLTQAGVLSLDYANRGIDKPPVYDFVTLVVAEGFPTILGEDPNDRAQAFALPEGTRALVLEWSPRLREPVPSGNLYQTMVDQTSLLILNGPHVGRELNVKNMHISMSDD
jgi:polar amino acid transport system substrate-binding protein